MFATFPAKTSPQEGDLTMFSVPRILIVEWPELSGKNF